MYDPIRKVMPEQLRCVLDLIDTHTEEIRLRVGFPPSIVVGNRELSAGVSVPCVSQDDLDAIVVAASGGSRYALQESIRSGFITLPRGHRIGICGEAIIIDGCVREFRSISSVVIRIASSHKACGVPLHESTLILGPPGCGKTTLLRDCIRILSDEQGMRVSLVDERGEVAACRDGNPQLNVGRRTDVLTGVYKAEGMLMLLRAMNPQWIAVDEITREEDVESMDQIAYCGVRILATAHGYGPDDLRTRSVYQRILRKRMFRKLLVMRHDHSFTMEEL